MRVHSISIGAALLSALLVAGGACKPDPLPGDVRGQQGEVRAPVEADMLGALPLARIGPQELRYADYALRAELASLPLREEQRLGAGRRALLQAVLQTEAMAQDTLRRGLTGEDEVRFHERIALARVAARSAFRPETPEEDALWEAEADQVRLPERVELTTFSWATREEAEAQLDRLTASVRTAARAPAIDVAEQLRVAQERAPEAHRDHGLVSAAAADLPDEVVRRVFLADPPPAVRFLPEVVPHEERWLVVWVGLRFAEVDVPREDALIWLRERALRTARAQSARAGIEALREQTTIRSDAARLARIEAWRAAEDLGVQEPERPRWFSAENLSDDPRAYLGDAQRNALEEARLRRGTLDQARARIAALSPAHDEAEEAPELENP